MIIRMIIMMMILLLLLLLLTTLEGVILDFSISAFRALNCLQKVCTDKVCGVLPH